MQKTRASQRVKLRQIDRKREDPEEESLGKEYGRTGKGDGWLRERGKRVCGF